MPELTPHGRSKDASAHDVSDLNQFGYQQHLRRALGPVGSFAIAFSMISITTSIFYLFPTIFETSGGVGIWLWIPCSVGVFLIVMVYAHLAARMPITGFAYQWTSRLTNNHYGWFTGWTCLCAFYAGTASIAAAFGSIFAPYLWTNPTHGDIETLAIISIVAAVILNVVSIRAVAWVNNVGASAEVFGTVVAAILLFFGALFFFHHPMGGHVLFQRGAAGGGIPLWYGLVLSSLLPVFTLLGWEGAADLSEETHDPRRTTPLAMIRANYTSMGFAFFVVVAFAIAIPAGIKAMLAQPKSPLLYIFQVHFGGVAEDVLAICVFGAVFSCMLANMVVATRLGFALARDNMLPGSRYLAHVPERTKTPVLSIVLCGLVAIGVNVMSQSIANNVVSIVDLAYYSIYFLVIIGVVVALRTNRIPDLPTDGKYFSLGRWLKPIMIVAFLWIIAIMLAGALPQAGHVGFKYLVGAEIIGALWYVFVLRSRLNKRQSGVDRIPTGEHAVVQPQPEVTD